ncbi:hypothetical protein [Curtobacterium sp. PhB115]|uniref:hypothetical protein n=1 Tax=Curtobacterium sp. PhB115 TaxID=2485173 RepID=UPI000F4CC3C9|nr:hypothetical protein [Curtobacterium sp. PhB115]ROP74818.1 hypothetical protein EDF19_0905 [Curtobacterium sp. PhB115]
MTARRSGIAVLAAVVLLPGLLVGCSGGSPDGTASRSAGAEAKGASLAECMRDKGYEMADPTAGGSGMQFSVPDGVDPAQYQDDMKTCLEKVGGRAGAGTAEQVEGAAEDAEELAKCIRANGFEDYPDDPDAVADFRPDDEQAYDEVSKQCGEKVYGKGSMAEEK